MDSDQSRDFTFSGTDNRPDTLLQQRKRKNKKATRSGARLTAFFLFALLVVAGLFAFAYMDMRRRVDMMEAREEIRAAGLSEGFQARLDQMAATNADLQKSLTRKVFPMDEIFLALEGTTASLENKLKQVEDTVGRVKTSTEALAETKADRAALEAVVSRIDAALPEIRQAVETAGAETGRRLDALAETQEKRAAELTEAVARIGETLATATADMENLRTGLAEAAGGLSALKTQMGAISGRSVTEKTVADAMEKQAAIFEKQLDRLAGQIRQKEQAIREMGEKLESVENIARASANALKTSPPRTIQVQPRPGTFLEQDIQ